MKAGKVEGPQEPNNRKRQKAHDGRPKRAAGSATVGFGNVMRDVRGTGGKGRGGEAGAPGEGSAGTATDASTRGGLPVTITPGTAGFDPALGQALQLDPGARAAREMGSTASATELADEASFGIRDASESLKAQDRSPVHQAAAQPLVPTPLARMTPAALLETVLDESTRLAIEEASRELHVELEPADLGPVVVRLRRGPDGTLDIGFRTREGDAARVLESGSELLRERLAEAGYSSVRIAVAHDRELRLTGDGRPG